MKLDIEYDSNLAEMKKVIEMGGVKSMSRAMNAALVEGRKCLKQAAAKVYTIKANDFAKRTMIVKCNPGDLEKGAIIVKSPELSSFHFRFTPTKYKSQAGIKVAKREKKGSITVKRGKKERKPQAFIINPNAMPQGHMLLFEREGIKVSAVSGVHASEIAEDTSVYNPTVEAMEKAYDEKLTEYLKKQFKVEE